MLTGPPFESLAVNSLSVLFLFWLISSIFSCMNSLFFLNPRTFSLVFQAAWLHPIRSSLNSSPSSFFKEFWVISEYHFCRCRIHKHWIGQEGKRETIESHFVQSYHCSSNRLKVAKKCWVNSYSFTVLPYYVCPMKPRDRSLDHEHPQDTFGSPWIFYSNCFNLSSPNFLVFSSWMHRVSTYGYQLSLPMSTSVSTLN